MPLSPSARAPRLRPQLICPRNLLMVKKLSAAACVLVVLLLVAFFVFKRIAGPSDGARLLPADTLLYVSLNDLLRSAVRWQGTALAEIGSEPEVKAFLEKPLSKLQSDPGAGEAGGLLAGLKPTRIFLAVTAATTERVDVAGGFQFWGGRNDFDRAVARLRKELPAGESSVETYAGDEIVGTKHGRFSLFTAAHGRWGFLSNDAATLKALLDRASGKSTGPSLAESPDFLKSVGPMLTAPDLLFFARPAGAVDILLEAGRSMGAEAIPDQIGELRATQAVAGTWKLDGKLQRDAIFLLRPGSQPAEALAHKSVRFTGPDSVLYLDFIGSLAGLPGILNKALPERQDAAAELAGLAVRAFGPEGAFVADWHPGQMTPSGIVALQIRDAALAADAVKRFITFFPEATVTEQDGIKLYSLPSVSNPLAAPTFTLTPEFLIAGINPEAVVHAAGAAGPTIESQAAFQPALKTFQSANEAFAFLDTRMVFERAYTAMRPVILFGAQVMPGVSGFVDTSKLPQTDTISKHLPPVIFSQQRLAEGVLIQSSGPFTVSQIAAGLAAGAAAGAPAAR